MTLLLHLFLIFLYLSFRNKYSDTSKKKYIWITSIVLICISGLRHMGVGNDTLASTIRFEEVFFTSWKEILGTFLEQYFSPSTELGKDPGYNIYNKLMSLFFKDETIYLFSISIILLGTLGRFFYKNARDLRHLLFAYVFFVTMFYGYLPNSSARQSLALAILLWGYMLLQETNRNAVLKFVFFVLLASIFHKSSLAAIVFLFVKTNSPKNIYYFAVFAFVIMLFYYQDVARFFSLFSDIYEGYGKSSYYVQQSRPIMVVILMAGLFIMHFFVIEIDSRALEYNMAYVGAAITLVLTPLIWSDPSILRLLSYFGVWVCIMVPHSLDLFSSSTKKTLFLIILSIFVAKAILSPDNYKFNWQQMELHERYG